MVELALAPGTGRCMRTDAVLVFVTEADQDLLDLLASGTVDFKAIAAFVVERSFEAAPFVVIDLHSGSTFVFGDVEVRAGNDQVLWGASSSTWVESALDLAATISVGSDAVDDGTVLVGGIVPAGGFRFGPPTGSPLAPSPAPLIKAPELPEVSAATDPDQAPETIATGPDPDDWDPLADPDDVDLATIGTVERLIDAPPFDELASAKDGDQTLPQLVGGHRPDDQSVVEQTEQQRPSGLGSNGSPAERTSWPPPSAGPPLPPPPATTPPLTAPRPAADHMPLPPPTTSPSAPNVDPVALPTPPVSETQVASGDYPGLELAADTAPTLEDGPPSAPPADRHTGPVGARALAGVTVRFDDGRAVPISAGVVVGRNPGKATNPEGYELITIRGEHVSRLHWRLTVTTDAVRVVDLGSRSGTEVDLGGQRVTIDEEGVAVLPGAVIHFADRWAVVEGF